VRHNYTLGIQTTNAFLSNETLGAWRPMAAERVCDDIAQVADDPTAGTNQWGFSCGDCVLCRMQQVHESAFVSASE